MLENKTIWQIAAGDTNRNYSDICLKYNVILNGPGEYGDLINNMNHYAQNLSKKKLSDINRFCGEIKDGDIVVLRIGTSEVRGVGVVVYNYQWDERFSDVDGWDLQHTRKVNWLWRGNQKFDNYSMKLGDTTQKLTSSDIISWIQSLNLNFADNDIKLVQHDFGKDISFEDIFAYLFDKGISSNSIELLSKDIEELVRIAKWYKGKNSPSESETIAYLVIPLLRALGWTPQKMAVEWKNIDVALFSKLPRIYENLDTVIEVKKKGDSCLMAFDQAKGYAMNHNSCLRLIVTDGLRYGVYFRTADNFELKAYLNLTSFKDSYGIYDCAGAKEAIYYMTLEALL